MYREITIAARQSKAEKRIEMEHSFMQIEFSSFLRPAQRQPLINEGRFSPVGRLLKKV